MKNCPSCTAEVSELAFDCPNCGHPIRKPKRGVFGAIIKWLFILFNIFMIWWIFSGLGAAVEGQQDLTGQN